MRNHSTSHGMMTIPRLWSFKCDLHPTQPTRSHSILTDIRIDDCPGEAVTVLQQLEYLQQTSTKAYTPRTSRATTL